jgi:hypothetical protein
MRRCAWRAVWLDVGARWPNGGVVLDSGGARHHASRVVTKRACCLRASAAKQAQLDATSRGD